MSNLATWNFKNAHVQTDGLTAEIGNYVSSESVVLCAFSTQGANPTPAELIPIGVLQNVGIQQQKQINQLYEIGSRKAYFIPGRVMIQIQLSRVLFNGDSLMAVLYGGATDATEGGDNAGSSYTNSEGTSTGKFYMNLAADFFNSRLDLAIIVQDSQGDPAGAVIFRECFIQAHGMGISSNQTIVAENVSLRCQNIESVSIAAAASGTGD